MEKCCLFNQPEEKFKESKDFEVVKKYADIASANECQRRLLKCKKCGALFLYQFLEWDAGGVDNYYSDYIQVANEEEADQLNAKLGFHDFASSANPMIKYGTGLPTTYRIPNK